MSDFIQRLEKEVVIGPGPESLRSQYDIINESGGWWAINNPERYQDTLKSEFDMGCDYVVAGGAERFDLKKFDLQDKTREINHGTLKLAKEVTPDNCYLGCGIMATLWIPPVTNTEKLYQTYLEQIVTAQEIGIDFWQIIGADILQMEIAVKAIRDNSELPIVALLNLDPTPKGFRSMYGADPTTSAKKLEEAGVDVIGIICGGINYEETTAVLKEIRAACNKPLAAKPNAGTPKLVDAKVVHPAGPEEMAKEAPNWVSAGARMVSGCCGTTPEHIEKVMAVLK
jgi:5-methyltetrahydrofolate--homocysteine methyltransferase